MWSYLSDFNVSFVSLNESICYHLADSTMNSSTCNMFGVSNKNINPDVIIIISAKNEIA